MNGHRIEYSGRIVKGSGTFHDVMMEFPYERLCELLNDPEPIDEATMAYVVNWCRPKPIQGRTFADAAVEAGTLKTRSEVYRKVKEGAMKWNGRRVADANMVVEFLEPGWGVVQLGKKTHDVLLDRGWQYADQPNKKEAT